MAFLAFRYIIELWNFNAAKFFIHSFNKNHQVLFKCCDNYKWPQQCPERPVPRWWPRRRPSRPRTRWTSTGSRGPTATTAQNVLSLCLCQDTSSVPTVAVLQLNMRRWVVFVQKRKSLSILTDSRIQECFKKVNKRWRVCSLRKGGSKLYNVIMAALMTNVFIDDFVIWSGNVLVVQWMIFGNIFNLQTWLVILLASINVFCNG